MGVVRTPKYYLCTSANGIRTYVHPSNRVQILHTLAIWGFRISVS